MPWSPAPSISIAASAESTSPLTSKATSTPPAMSLDCRFRETMTAHDS